MELSTLQVQMLFRCNKKPISKRQVTQQYHRHTKANRDVAIQDLIDRSLLVAQKLPKPGANKTPTFYKITPQGLAWLEQYQANYPK